MPVCAGGGWIFRCAESASPAFWKSPGRAEKSSVLEVIIAAKPLPRLPFLIETESVYAHADGVGPPDGVREKCGAVYSEALEKAGRQRLDLHTKRTFTSLQMAIKMDESTTSMNAS